MLYIVLGLVLAAFGLLIAALTTANTLWAWLSVVISVAAAAALIADWLRNRRETEAKATAVTTATTAAEPAEYDEPDRYDKHDTYDRHAEPALHEPGFDHLQADHAEPVTPVDRAGSAPVTDDEVPSGAPVQEPVAAVTESRGPDAVPEVGPDEEPPEEATDATDLLVVSGLYAEVRVVDERPRYHLAKCSWLAARPTLPLPVTEARQLGFTPCAVCGPDAVLARRHREGHGTSRTSHS